MHHTGGVEDDKMVGTKEDEEKAGCPSPTPIVDECLVAALRLTAHCQPSRETKSFHGDKKLKEESKEHQESLPPSNATTIGQSIDVDEDTERNSILPTFHHTSNRRGSSFELYKDPSVLLWTKSVASAAENMHARLPNFSHPIVMSSSSLPRMPTPDLAPLHPPPAHFTDPEHPQPSYIQNPLHRSEKTLSANVEIDLNSIYNLYSTCTSKPSKPYIAHFAPPLTSAFPVPSPPASHLNFSLPKSKERRTNWRLEEYFPFMSLQRMKRKHKKRLYGALFAIFFVATLGAGVGFLIHGVGDGKRGSSSDGPQDGSPTKAPMADNPKDQGSSVGASEVKKEHILWMVIIGCVLVGCHAIFASVMIVLYGPRGTRRKKYVRDGRGGAVEMPR